MKPPTTQTDQGSLACAMGAAWPSLKVPKHEIFVPKLFILSYLIWIGDLGIEPKNPLVHISVRVIFAILLF
jgi:hypothetical protein